MGQEVPDRIPKPFEVDRLGLELLAPRESEQAANQLAPLLGRPLGHRKDPALLLVELSALVDKAKAADHGCEKIVEVVSDAAGQLADRIHLLCLDQLVFERALLGDVGERARELDRPAVRILEKHRLVEEMLVTAVGALPAIFDRQAPRFSPRLQRGKNSVAVVGMKPFGPDLRLARDLFERKTGDRLEIAADIVRPSWRAVVRLEVEDHRERFDDHGLALLGAAQLLLRAQVGRRSREGSHREAPAPWRAFRSTSLDFSNRSTNTATFERRMIGSTGLNT